MVAHNKNYQPAAPVKPARNPRTAAPVDKVNPLHETDLICELADPSTSLEELCAAHEFSLEALSLWMARPDVAERLDLIQTTAMTRARFIGRLTLPVAAQSAANIINAHKLRPQKPTIDAAFGSDLHRANETMLKAARFLQRLTAEPAPPRTGNRARKSDTPSPKQEGTQGVGEASKASGDRGTQSSVQLNAESNAQSSAQSNANCDADSPRGEPANVIQRDQRSTPRARREPNRRPRRNSTAHSKKVRTRTPHTTPRTTPKSPSRPTQSRSNSTPTPVPKPSSSSLSQPRGAPPHRARNTARNTARTAENSTAPPRPTSHSSAPRSASG